MVDSIGVPDAQETIFYFPDGVSPRGGGDVSCYFGRWDIDQ